MINCSNCARLEREILRLKGDLLYHQDRHRLQESLHNDSRNLFVLHRDRADELQRRNEELMGELAQLKSEKAKLKMGNTSPQPLSPLLRSNAERVAHNVK
jgi:hypothetical protein